MVKSRKVHSPQSYVEAVTGRYYCFQKDDVVKEIHDLLRLNKKESKKKPLRDYPLDAICEIVENDVDVVLVDCSYVNDECQIVTEYRWFEVPEGFEEDE